jgi:hypothetical protein
LEAQLIGTITLPTLRCLKQGFKEQDVVIDAVLSNSATDISPVADNINVLHLYNKANEIATYQSTFRDVRATMTSFSKA